MFMKKTLFATIAIILVGLFYYFTIGSQKITEAIKKEVNREVIALKKSGFNIKTAKVDNSKEHFEIDFNDTKKIVEYLRQKGIKSIDQEEALLLLQGAVLGVDIEYNPSPTKAIAMDIYPIRFPLIFYVLFQGEDNSTIKKLEEITKNKELLAHIEVNKLATAFEGYLKDFKIDNRFEFRGFKFNGGLEKEKIKSINYNIDHLYFYNMEDNLKIEVSNLILNINNPFDEFNRESRFNIGEFRVIDLLNQKEYIAKNIIGKTEDTQKNSSLLDSLMDVKISRLDILDKKSNREVKFEEIKTEVYTKNLDIKLIEKLNSIQDSKDIKGELINIYKKLASDEFKIEIPNISVSSITINKRKLKGFRINATLYINKDIKEASSGDITKLFNVKLKIKASNELVSAISTSNPHAMVLMMLFQPKDENGTKVYDIEVKSGNFFINGRALL